MRMTGIDKRIGLILIAYQGWFLRISSDLTKKRKKEYYKQLLRVRVRVRVRVRLG
jgi:hypothetical protein